MFLFIVGIIFFVFISFSLPHFCINNIIMLFAIFSHFSHADIPESCVRFVGGHLDDIIKVNKEVLHKSERTTH